MNLTKNNATSNNCHCHCDCEKPNGNITCASDCNCSCSQDCDCGCQEGQPCTCDNSCSCDKDTDNCDDEHRQKLNNTKSKEFSIKQNNIIKLPKNTGFIAKSKQNKLNTRAYNNIVCNDVNCQDSHCAEIDTPSNKLKQNKKENSCACARCNDTKVSLSKNLVSNQIAKTLLPTMLRLGLAIILLLMGIFIKLPKYVNLAFYIPSFLFAGGQYVFKAIKNILHGKIFDENFLMTIASIGAFCIGDFPEGIAVMLLYSVGEMLQDFAVDKSKRNIAEMMNLKTPYANKIVGGNILKIKTDDIAIGDKIVVATGEKIPVDGIVIDGESFVDNSMLNGEYKPMTVAKNQQVLGGGILKGNAITLQATKLFKDTTASKIIELVESAQDKKPKSQQFISKFAKIYTPIVVFAALIIALLPPAILGFSSHFSQYLNKALVFLVISCPCALVISVPLGFFAGIGGASKRGILFKGGNYLESLNNIDVFAFDKTGTLTEGVFQVAKINAINVTQDELLKICAYAEAKSNHPIAESIKRAYNTPIDNSIISDYSEISGLGISLKIENAPILCGSAKFMQENNINIPKLSDYGTIIHISKNNVYLGNIIISDKTKPDAFKVIATLLHMKKEVLLLSGDRLESVKFVADKLNITQYRAELLPQDKANLITNLINSGKKVAFVGDGLNDAPVLKLSTLGICMSGLSNDASIEASDMILSNGNIMGVLTAIKCAKKTRSVVSLNIALSLLTKALIMIISLTIFTSMWLALIADVGVSLLAIINSTRAFKIKQ